MKRLCKTIVFIIIMNLAMTSIAYNQSYSAYSSINDLIAANNSQYAAITRVSGTTGYTGFWFFGIEQFDKTDRYILAMKVYIKDREVTRENVADIGYILNNPPVRPTSPNSSPRKN